MDIKSIILLGLISLLILYVVYLRVEEKLLIEKTICESGACIRFCDGSNTNIFIDNETAFENLKRPYQTIMNKYCNLGFDNSEFPWHFLENGYVNYTEDGDSTILQWFEYCLNFIEDSPEGESKFEIYSCIVESTADKIKTSYPYFMLASIPFLIITIFIYAWIPDLRNLPGKCLLGYIFSIMTLYVVYSISVIYNDFISQIPFLCEASGYAVFASFLMCFLWLNVLCYDVFSTIRKIHDREGLILLKYTLYGSGIPIIATLLLIIFHKHELIPSRFRHTLGVNNMCFIGGTQDLEIVYKVIPLTILLSINVVFYATTAFTIFKIQRQTAIVKTNTRHMQNKQRFFLYFRLFVIMGITWVAEAISYFVEANLFLNAISIINCLQGVLIFIHFIWRSRVQKLIRRKVNLKSELRAETTSTVMSMHTIDSPLRKFSTCSEMPLKKMTSVNEFQ